MKTEIKYVQSTRGIPLREAPHFEWLTVVDSIGGYEAGTVLFIYGSGQTEMSVMVLTEDDKSIVRCSIQNHIALHMIVRKFREGESLVLTFKEE